jgi:cellulose synthase/poly-beta-1,6-N-acetylglucosamine synthase-like glycosyltransferase
MSPPVRLLNSVPTASSESPYIVMLVPACNEESHIEATLQSLNHQTRRPDETIVVLNNSTDRTGEIVSSMIPRFPGLKLLTMAENKAKKSGALNYGLQSLDLTDRMIIGEMDADTKVANNIIEEGLKEFQANPRLGGVCSRCGAKPFDECGEREPGQRPTKWEYVVWLSQVYEYGITDLRRAEVAGKVKVMAGAFTLYTATAIRQVAKIYTPPGEPMQVFDESSRVEDYVLTLDVRGAGFEALCGQRMRAWTDVPITLLGPRGLFKQRIRWYGGSVDEFRRRRFRPEIRHDVMMEAFTIYMSLSKLLAVLAFLFIWWHPAIDAEWGVFAVSVLVLAVVVNLVMYGPCVGYIEHVPRALQLLPLTILPLCLYRLWDEAVLYLSYIDSFTGKNQRW